MIERPLSSHCESVFISPSPSLSFFMALRPTHLTQSYLISHTSMFYSHPLLTVITLVWVAIFLHSSPLAHVDDCIPHSPPQLS